MPPTQPTSHTTTQPKINQIPQHEAPHQTTQISNKVANQKAPQSSWVDKIRVTKASTRFTLDSVPCRASGSILELDDELIDEDAEWLRYIIGFFLGYDMSFHDIRYIAMRVWKASDLKDVRFTGMGFLIFQFNIEDQVHSILEWGPWMFEGKNIVL